MPIWIIIIVIVACLVIGFMLTRIRTIYGGAKNPKGVKGAAERSPVPLAYCTLVMKGDNYIPGALALGESLCKYCPGQDSICMVTDDVSEEAKVALRRVFTHVRDVPYINHKSRTASKRQEELYSAWMSSSFTKWNLLDFTDYSKILFMDADTVATEDLRPLFDLPAPAICMGSPWMRPWAEHGLPNPMGAKKHGERVLTKEIWRQLKLKAAGMMGGVVLLAPKAGLTDKLRAMLAKYEVFPPIEYKCMASADEQAIAQLMVETGQQWTNIGNRYNYMVGKTAFLEGQEPAVKHYYHNKPWDYPRTEWVEYEKWYEYVDSLVTRIPEMKQWFKNL